MSITRNTEAEMELGRAFQEAIDKLTDEEENALVGLYTAALEIKEKYRDSINWDDKYSDMAFKDALDITETLHDEATRKHYLAKPKDLESMARILRGKEELKISSRPCENVTVNITYHARS